METVTLSSPRAEFRAKLAAFAEEHSDLSTRDLADLFGSVLPDAERALVAEFLSSEAHNILAWELRAQFSQTRQGIFAALDIANPDRPAVAALGEQQRERLFDRISQWREFVPSENRTKLIMEFTRPTLLESAQFDAGRAAHHGWKMLLKTRLAEGLPDESTPVGSHYTPDQVAELGETIQMEMSRGNFRLKIQPVRPLSRPTPVQGQVDGGNSTGPEVDRGVAAQ